MPWSTWNILRRLELACNNPAAAHAAKQQAIQSYWAYRRDGGENMSGSQVPQLCQSVLLAVRENTGATILKALSGLKDLKGLGDYLNPVIPKLIAICQGDRNPALALEQYLNNSDIEVVVVAALAAKSATKAATTLYKCSSVIYAGSQAQRSSLYTHFN